MKVQSPQGQAPSTSNPEPPGWFRRVTFYGLLSALTPLILVPYLDDRVLAVVRRRMISGLLRDNLMAVDPALVRLLDRGEGSFRGSRRLLLRASRALRRKGVQGASSDPILRQQEEKLGGKVSWLSAKLEEQGDYFTALEGEFELQFARNKGEATRR